MQICCIIIALRLMCYQFTVESDLPVQQINGFYSTVSMSGEENSGCLCLWVDQVLPGIREDLEFLIYRSQFQQPLKHRLTKADPLPVNSPGFLWDSHMSEFRAKIVVIGFLMFSSGSLVRSCWAEVKYDRILAVGGRGFELWLLKVQKNIISSIFSLRGWQVLLIHY